MSGEWPWCGTWLLRVTCVCPPPPASIVPPTSSPLPAPSVSPSGFNSDTGNITLQDRYSQLVSDCSLCLFLPVAPTYQIWHLFCFVPLPPTITSVLRSINLLCPACFKYKSNSSKSQVLPILKMVNFSLRPAYSAGLDPRRWNPNGKFPHSLWSMYRMTVWERANRRRQYYEKKLPDSKTTD